MEGRSKEASTRSGQKDSSIPPTEDGMKPKNHPLKTLWLDLDHQGTFLTGVAIIGDCLCAVNYWRESLWIHNLATDTTKRLTISGLWAVGIATRGDNLVITDISRKVHFVRLDQNELKIVAHTVKPLLFTPWGISVDPSADKLLIANYSDCVDQIVTCDVACDVESNVTVSCDIPSMKSVLVASSGGLYIVLDGSHQGRVMWVNGDGDIVHTYGGSLRSPGHMVQDSRGNLLVADTYNNRLHLVGPDKEFLRYLLTEDDGIKSVHCICLDEAGGRLVVGHDQCEIRVYDWSKLMPSMV